MINMDNVMLHNKIKCNECGIENNPLYIYLHMNEHIQLI